MTLDWITEILHSKFLYLFQKRHQSPCGSASTSSEPLLSPDECYSQINNFNRASINRGTTLIADSQLNYSFDSRQNSLNKISNASKRSPNPLMRRTPCCCHIRQPCKDKSTLTAKPRAAATVAMRLRFILQQLNSGTLDTEELRKNLEYACLVLEAAYYDDQRRILDENEDYEDLVPQEMPSEVREWLASTFSRPSGRKIKFKSVANAIRSGIAFDKLFRRISHCPPIHIPVDVANYLKDVDSWNFDVFRLNEGSHNKALKYIGLDLFGKYGILSRFKMAVSTLEGFLNQLELGYSRHKNPYHNLVHAADVTQTTHWFLSQTGLLQSLTDVEAFACLFSALIHDYEHTGHTNNFHLQSLSDLALLYNDKSVLENHHISAVFRFMRDDAELNILQNLSKEEFREFRSLVIEIVLSTDMSLHFGQIKTVRTMLSNPESIDKVKALSLLVHCADISHPSKPWPTHFRWTMSVLEEFFRQGDLEEEMGLQYSPLCDRKSTHVAESQIGFIDFIVEPCFLVCIEMLTKMLEPLALSGTAGPALSESKSSALNEDGRLKSADSNSSTSPRSFGKLPLNADGQLAIPQPFLNIIHENKFKWREKSAADEET